MDLYCGVTVPEHGSFSHLGLLRTALFDQRTARDLQSRLIRYEFSPLNEVIGNHIPGALLYERKGDGGQCKRYIVPRRSKQQQSWFVGTLPPEIVHKILDCLPEMRDLVFAGLTCQRLFEFLRPRLYAHLKQHLLFDTSWMGRQMTGFFAHFESARTRYKEVTLARPQFVDVLGDNLDCIQRDMHVLHILCPLTSHSACAPPGLIVPKRPHVLRNLDRKEYVQERLLERAMGSVQDPQVHKHLTLGNIALARICAPDSMGRRVAGERFDIISHDDHDWHAELREGKWVDVTQETCAEIERLWMVEYFRPIQN